MQGNCADFGPEHGSEMSSISRDFQFRMPTAFFPHIYKVFILTTASIPNLDFALFKRASCYRDIHAENWFPKTSKTILPLHKCAMVFFTMKDGFASFSNIRDTKTLLASVW